MKRITTLIITLILIASFFTACGKSKEVAPTITENTEKTITVEKTENTATPSPKVSYPLTVKDYSGFEMTFEKKPENIISLTLATDEILVDMVDKSRIKALEIFSDDPGLSNIIEVAKTFPVKLNSEVEKIIDLQPDLVFVADWKEKEFVQQLRDAKIPVYVFKAPTSFDDLKKAITDIATLTDETEKGNTLIKGIDTKLNEINDKIKTIKPEEKLTVLDYSFFGTSYGLDTSFDELANKAGLVNVISKEGTKGWPEVPKEKVIELDPDIIFLHAWSYDKKTDPQKFADEFKKDKSFANLKAVKNNRVYILEDKHTADNSQYMVLGVEDMAKAAYPDLFK